jgi:hypothetical protein
MLRHHEYIIFNRVFPIGKKTIARFIEKINTAVCTAGGAMVRFLAGKKLPLIEAMEKAWERNPA